MGAATCHCLHSRHRRTWCSGWCPDRSQTVGKRPSIRLGRCDARKCLGLAGLQRGRTMALAKWLGKRGGKRAKPTTNKTDRIGQARKAKSPNKRRMVAGCGSAVPPTSGTPAGSPRHLRRQSANEAKLLPFPPQPPSTSSRYLLPPYQCQTVLELAALRCALVKPIAHEDSAALARVYVRIANILGRVSAQFVANRWNGWRQQSNSPITSKIPSRWQMLRHSSRLAKLLPFPPQPL